MSRTLLFIMQSMEVVVVSIQGGMSIFVGCKTNPRFIFFSTNPFAFLFAA